MNTNYLVPDYTKQALNGFRFKLHESTERLRTPNIPILRAGIYVALHLTNDLTSLIAFPFKIIESIAFTAINLVGSAFSQTCQKNLEISAKMLLKESSKVLLVITILAVNVLLLYTGIIELFPEVLLGTFLLFLGYELDKFSNIDELSYSTKLEYYRIGAVRVHGRENIEIFESLNEYSQRQFDKEVGDAIIKKYQALSKTPRSGFEEFYTNTIKEIEDLKEAKVNEEARAGVRDKSKYNYWYSPLCLKSPDEGMPEDLIERKILLRNILSLSHKVNCDEFSSQMQVKPYLLEFFDLGNNPSDDEIKTAYKKTQLRIHPDKFVIVKGKWGKYIDTKELDGLERYSTESFKIVSNFHNKYFDLKNN